MANAKECSKYHIIALISHASKVILKILQARFHQYMHWELLEIQTEFRKGRGTRDQIANISWIIEKAKEFQKNVYFCIIDCAKAVDCVDHNKLWKILIEIQISKSHGHFKISKSRGKLKKSCLVLCKSMDCSTPCRDGFSCLSLFLKFAQIYVIWVGDAI